MTVILPVTFVADMGAPEPRIGKPDWVAVPTVEDLAVLPASKEAMTISVQMDCRVGEGGALQDCRTVSESPRDLGVAAALGAISNKFVVSIWTDEGLPTIGGRVTVPFRYNIE